MSHLPQRKPLRLAGYDYRQFGAYFVTICVHQRLLLFGEVVDEQMRLNAVGEMVAQCWAEIPSHFDHVALDEYVIMPNHLHGIIVIKISPPTNATPSNATTATLQTQTGSLPAIVRSFKAAVTCLLNRSIRTIEHPVWQGRYYEHVIRDDNDLSRIRQYIVDNPCRWALDAENPTP